MDEKWYPTSEHYFQAMKFEDEAYQEKIRTCHSPMEAANLGRSRQVKLREDWEEVKIDIMRDAVLKKFTTHEELRELLRSTADQELVENAPGDYFWGCGKSGSGKNWLGKILMEVREQLKQRE